MADFLDFIEKAIDFISTRYYVIRVSHKDRPYAEIEYVNKEGYSYSYHTDFKNAQGYDFFAGNTFFIKMQMNDRERRNDYVVVSEQELTEITHLVDFYTKNTTSIS